MRRRTHTRDDGTRPYIAHKAWSATRGGGAGRWLVCLCERDRLVERVEVRRVDRGDEVAHEIEAEAVRDPFPLARERQAVEGVPPPSARGSIGKDGAGRGHANTRSRDSASVGGKV